MTNLQSGFSQFSGSKQMGKINKQWHLQNKMPKNPSENGRLKWHIEHEKNCSCRPMPENLKIKIEEFQKGK